MASVNIKINGRVQGVFFRQSAKREADKLRLVGWIRNDPDGSVEVLAVGSKSKVEEFIIWCKKGSPAAKVEKVGVKWEENGQIFSSFEIR